MQKLIEITTDKKYDTGICFSCNSKKDIHIVIFNRIEANDRNIICLCRNCLNKLKLELEETLNF